MGPWASIMVWRLLPLLVAATAIAVGVVVMDTRQAAAVGREDVPELPCDMAEGEAAVGKLSRLLTYRTVSNAEAPLHVEDEGTFHAAWGYLETEAYPLLWEKLTVEKVGTAGLSRLFTWRGKDSSLPPLLLIAHIDVVPEGQESAWTHPPFSGKDADGYIWGRGAIDMKQVLIAVLEGLQSLLVKEPGFVPARDVLFAVGHDEEVLGSQGAQQIAELLRNRYGRVSFILDEGAAILTNGLPPFTSDPVHILGTAEKGGFNMALTIRAPGGHSSMPPPAGSGALDHAARFIEQLAARPMEPRLQPPLTDTIDALAPFAPPVLRAVLKRNDVWPISKLVPLALQRKGLAPGANVYSTVVVTQVAAGVAANVIPEEVVLLLNCRLLYGDSVESVQAHLRGLLRAAGVPDAAALFEVQGPVSLPSVATSAHEAHYRAVKQAVQETCRVNGKAISVAPSLFPGATDSRHYSSLTQHGTVRMTSVLINATAGDMARVHGVDERIGRRDFLRALCTYRRTIHLLAQL